MPPVPRTRLRVRLLALMSFITCVVAAVGITPGAASASTPDPAAWVGSPINGAWPDTNGCAGAAYPSSNCSLPWVHHITYATSYDWGSGVNDWAADLQRVNAGQRVMLYAAPQNGGYDVAARVDKVQPACAPLLGESYSSQINRGGYQVQVGLYVNGTKIGSATYAHINPSVSQGQWVARWGSQLGVVGSYTYGGCWQGAHVHVELSSRHNYACYSNVFRGIPWGIAETNFIGFVGGSYASGPRQACP
jgi:hypothetical protein